MHAWSRSISPKAPPAWRQRVGVVACLLALAVALFGHIEVAGAAAPGQDAAVVSLSKIDSPDGHARSSLSPHCVLQGHCSLQALLPLALPGTPASAEPVGISPDQFALGRTTAPQHHPPKAPHFQ